MLDEVVSPQSFAALVIYVISLRGFTSISGYLDVRRARAHARAVTSRRARKISFEKSSEKARLSTRRRCVLRFSDES